MGWGGVSPAPGSLQSLVLLSRLPFVRLFQALLGLVAPEFFDKLAPCLDIKYCTSFNTFITKLCCYYNELFYILFSKCYLLVERSKTDFYVLTCILCNLAKFTF